MSQRTSLPSCLMLKEKSTTPLHKIANRGPGGQTGFFGKKSDGSEGDPAELSENYSEAWVQKHSMASAMVQARGVGFA